MLSQEDPFADKRAGFTGFHGMARYASARPPKPVVFMSPSFSGGHSSLSVSDCLGLFNAISHRVEGAVEEHSHVSRKRLAQECQTALVQLKEALLLAHARRWQLEVDVFDARADRTSLKAELARLICDRT